MIRFIVLVLLSGCHLVFGVDVPEGSRFAPDGSITQDGRELDDAHTDARLDAQPVDAAPPIDMPIDAPIPSIVRLNYFGPIYAEDCWMSPGWIDGHLMLVGSITGPFTVTITSADPTIISFPITSFTFTPATVQPIYVRTVPHVIGSTFVTLSAPDGTYSKELTVVECI